MNKKVQIDIRVSEIVKMLQAGKERPEMLAICGKLWRISVTSIDRLIKLARDKAAELLNKADQVIERETLSTASEAARNGLKSALEVDLKLQEIIFNKYVLIKTTVGYRKVKVPGIEGAEPLFKEVPIEKIIKVENTTANQLTAIDIFYKRRNLYKSDAPPPGSSTPLQLSDSQFNILLKTARETKANRGK